MAGNSVKGSRVSRVFRENDREGERERERAVVAKELLLVTRTVGERDFPQNSSVSSPPPPPSSPSSVISSYLP